MKENRRRFAAVTGLFAAFAGSCYSDKIPERRTRVIIEPDAGRTGHPEGGSGDVSGSAGEGAAVAGESGAAGSGGSAGGVPEPAGGAGAGGGAEDCVIRVDAAAKDAIPDGSSWESAYRDLSEAADAARVRARGAAAACELWVAGGEYQAPETGYDLEGASVLGGFRGDESESSTRSPDLNAVWLRGDRATPPPQVVRLAGDTRLDGVRVTRGATGILVESGTAVIDNVYVFDNGPSRGIDVTGGSATLRGVRVFDNTSVDTVGGGGLRSAARAEITITDSVFSANRAGGASTSQSREGGALLLLGREARVARTIFAGNSAKGGGGAISNAAPLHVADSVFVGNDSPSGSAVFSVTSAELTNVTVHANTSGPAIAGSATVVNSIVWGNSGGSLSKAATFSPAVLVSIIEGGYSAAGSQDVITGDPGLPGARFTAVAGELVARDVTLVLNHDGSVNPGALRDTFVRFEDGSVRVVLDNQRTNLTLLGGASSSWDGQALTVLSLEPGPSSLAIDRGWGDTEAHAVSDRDLLGRPRKDAAKPDQTSTGTPTFVDLGAYEFQP